MDSRTYFIYETTNLINGKKYRGACTTKLASLHPSYYGSGSLLLKAIEKYGKQNFRREILEFATSSEELYILESKYVTPEWVNSSNTYNMKVGGFGGFDHIRNNKEYENKRISAFVVSIRKSRDSARINKKCKNCSTTLTIRPKSKQTFCNKKCANEYNGKLRPSRIMQVNCISCGNTIEKELNKINKYPRHFCNKSCSGRYTQLQKKINKTHSNCGNVVLE